MPGTISGFVFMLLAAVAVIATAAEWALMVIVPIAASLRMFTFRTPGSRGDGLAELFVLQGESQGPRPTRRYS